MATKAPTKKAAPQHGEYRTDGERLVRVLDPGPNDTTWVEDAQTGEWEEMATKDLRGWKVVREAGTSGGE